jgi:hypothetical protein
MILLRDTDLPSTDASELEAAGYRANHKFRGEKYFPERTIVPICLVAFPRADSRIREWRVVHFLRG